MNRTKTVEVKTQAVFAPLSFASAANAKLGNSMTATATPNVTARRPKIPGNIKKPPSGFIKPEPTNFPKPVVFGKNISPRPLAI
jgi:hypothetical protein